MRRPRLNWVSEVSTVTGLLGCGTRDPGLLIPSLALNHKAWREPSSITNPLPCPSPPILWLLMFFVHCSPTWSIFFLSCLTLGIWPFWFSVSLSITGEGQWVCDLVSEFSLDLKRVCSYLCNSHESPTWVSKQITIQRDSSQSKSLKWQFKQLKYFLNSLNSNWESILHPTPY